MDRRTFLVNAVAATTATTGAFEVIAEKPKKSSGNQKHRVAIIGCGRMGQYFAEVFRRLPDTELAAIAEWNDERRPIVGKRFGIQALFKDVNAMLREMVPDLAVVVTPTKYMKEAVIKCAEAGVKGVMTEKPMAARLSDADEMVEACRKRGIVFAGGNLKRAKWEVQIAGQRLKSGEFGTIRGAAVHGFGGQISGGCCQHLSVLRLFTGAEVDEVIAWGSPAKALKQKDDSGLNINGRFRMSTGIDCQVFGLSQAYGSKENRNGVDVWTDDALVNWRWSVPKIFQGTDSQGARKEIDPQYPPFPWAHVLKAPPLRAELDYLVSSIRSFIDAVEKGTELLISGYDLRQALEIAIACKLSATQAHRPVQLPLKDRSLVLYPSRYRWLGGDAVGSPQTGENAAGKKKGS